MKKLLFAAIAAMCLISCGTTKQGCDYNRGKTPKFRACTGTLKQVDKIAYNRVVLHINTADTMLYVYHNFHYGIGGKRWPVGKQIAFCYDDTNNRAIISL